MKLISILIVIVLGGITFLADVAAAKSPGGYRSRPRYQNSAIDTFGEAKKVAHQVHDAYPFTIYCGCRYQKNHIDLQSCGYRVHKDSKRALRLEWEHVVPAEAFGNSFVEWRQGAPNCRRRGRAFKGRKCAGKNPEFNRMESDLYNLWPEVGELNGLRSNYSMSEISGPAISFGRCQAKIQNRKFEPSLAARGIVARVYLYMEQAYPGRGIISGKNSKLFEVWDQLQPVSERECRVGRKVFDLQHNENPILKARCKGRFGW